MQQELANDIYELATSHLKEEITKLLEEFDGQQITTVVELDAYEKECHQQEENKNDKDSILEESGHTKLVNQNKEQGTDREDVESTQRLEAEEEQHEEETTDHEELVLRAWT